jgi:hypothetical protein
VGIAKRGRREYAKVTLERLEALYLLPCGLFLRSDFRKVAVNQFTNGASFGRNRQLEAVLTAGG